MVGAVVQLPPRVKLLLVRSFTASLITAITEEGGECIVSVLGLRLVIAGAVLSTVIKLLSLETVDKLP
jgi:hypothetical protein